MATLVDVHFDNPDPDDCPITFVDLIALLNALVHGELQGDFVPYVTGAATPPVEDQDKVWHRLDANGRPMGTYHFYSGTWRKAYDHRLGEVVMYSGNPAIDFTGSGHRGTVGGEWDGFQLCSGENGSPNLTDKFIVGAKMDDLATGYPTGGPWKTTVGGTTEQEAAGVHEIALTENNVPRPARDEIKLGRWEAEGGQTHDVDGNLYGDFNATGNVLLIPAEPAIPPITFPTLPNYYALAYAVFVGYE